MSGTGQKLAQIVKPWPFYTTSDCTFRQNWNMAVCPHEYGKVNIRGFVYFLVRSVKKRLKRLLG